MASRNRNLFVKNRCTKMKVTVSVGLRGKLGFHQKKKTTNTVLENTQDFI